MTGKIDLHTHSKASDGLFTPTELIDYAIKAGVNALAITDHDTIDGLQEATEYAKKINFEFIPGIEFSVDYPHGALHLVGLYVDYKNSDLINVTQKLKEIRDRRALAVIEDLNLHGISITREEIEHEANGGAVGKPHIARVLLNKGYGVDIPDIFKNFMRRGKPGFASKERISLQDSVRIIKNAGGISILAHPISIDFKTYERFNKLIDKLVYMGVEGIEVYSSMHTLDEVNRFMFVAEKRNILISGGSDFHGDNSKEIGAYIPGRYIPTEILDNIKKYRERNEKAR